LAERGIGILPSSAPAPASDEIRAGLDGMGTRKRAAFTLVELVIVMVIIGLIASVAIPRMSRGAGEAAKSTAMADIYLVRSAIMRYAAEHTNVYPGPDEDGFIDQLTKYTSVTGQSADSRSATNKYGPYLLAIPACPVGPNAGEHGVLIDRDNSPPLPQPGVAKGWVYNPDTGEFIPNIDDGERADVDNVIDDVVETLGGVISGILGR